MWYSYAIIRVVPRVERGECINVGVILFAREGNFLASRIELDSGRLAALAPDVDEGLIRRHLDTFVAISDGRREGGQVAGLPPSERFHWLTAPRSTMIQTSPVHGGTTANPDGTLDELLEAFVRTPKG